MASQCLRFRLLYGSKALQYLVAGIVSGLVSSFRQCNDNKELAYFIS